MGQYWMPVNLDKKEFVNPHALGSGLKLAEQLGSHVGSALIILTAAHREQRGGGDFDLTKNWHGPERKFPEHNVTPGPMPRSYEQLAKETIGRWAGDRIAIVGDYAEDTDLPKRFKASKIYHACHPESKQVYTKQRVGKEDIYDMTDGPHHGEYYHFETVKAPKFRDITDDVCKVIEHELNGKFVGEGWREFKQND